jgi:NAD(P)-dependent dehydrogenase (short-subunit alcohol dehydrogenase family)
MTVHELFDIRGKTAVVTGGSIGLGKQMAEGLAEKGCNAVIANRDVSRGEETARDLTDRFGISSLALQLDVTSLESVESFKIELSKRVPDVDILVNSAGISLNTPLELSQESVETFRSILEVNVTGIFRCTAAIAPLMIKKGSGRIINISSIYGANGIDKSLNIDGGWLAW